MNQPIKLSFEEYAKYRAVWWASVPRFTRLTSFALDFAWIGLLIVIVSNWISDGSNDWTIYGSFVLMIVLSFRYDMNLRRQFHQELAQYLLRQEQSHE